MKFSAIVTAHNSDPNPIIDCLQMQTSPPDEILVGTSGDCSPVENRDGVLVKEFLDKSDYGYEKRNELAKSATGDMLGFFSCDDSYRRDYISLMTEVARLHRSDVVWCHWTSATNKVRHFFPFEFKPANATLGNFIIRRNVFIRVGGFQPFSEAPNNFGYFDAGLFEKLNSEKYVTITEVPSILYFHNFPVDIRVIPTVWGRALNE